jgi:hypothetical protein
VAGGRISKKLMLGLLSEGALIVYATAKLKRVAKSQKLLKRLNSDRQGTF